MMLFIIVVYYTSIFILVWHNVKQVIVCCLCYISETRKRKTSFHSGVFLMGILINQNQKTHFVCHDNTIGFTFISWVPVLLPRDTQVASGGSGQRAGLLRGDAIVEVDGQNVEDRWGHWSKLACTAQTRGEGEDRRWPPREEQTPSVTGWAYDTHTHTPTHKHKCHALAEGFTFWTLLKAVQIPDTAVMFVLQLSLLLLFTSGL